MKENEIEMMLEKLLESRKRVDAINEELTFIRTFILEMMNYLAGKLREKRGWYE